MIFDVTTFNLRVDVKNDNENSWGNRVSGVIEYIRKNQPLILCTQEGTKKMIDDLILHLDNYSYIGIVRKENEEYNAIFYDKNILECRCFETFWLSKTPNIPESNDFNSACTRICSFGEFVFINNKNNRFRVFNTHLDHISELAQTEGIKLIVNKMNNKNNEEELPTILTGDFNSTKSSPVIKYLKEGKIGNKNLIDAYTKVIKYSTTFHGFTGELEGDPIDHIYLTNDINLIETSIFIDKINNKYLTDHYPVTSKVEIIW